MIVRRKNFGVLKFDDSALEILESYRQLQPDSKEAGGILLGRHLKNERDLIVDEATAPQPGDRRSRFNFFRSFAHQNIALKRWVDAQQTCAYIGLWHTHPEPDPTPSRTDLRDWQRALKKHSFHGENLYFVIVGQTAIRIWEGDRSGALTACAFTMR